MPKLVTDRNWVYGIRFTDRLLQKHDTPAPLEGIQNLDLSRGQPDPPESEGRFLERKRQGPVQLCRRVVVRLHSWATSMRLGTLFRTKACSQERSVACYGRALTQSTNDVLLHHGRQQGESLRALPSGALRHLPDKTLARLRHSAADKDAVDLREGADTAAAATADTATNTASTNTYPTD